jgi:hypothetical protein
MTGASFTSAYLFDSGAGTPGESGAVASRSVIRIRMIGSWLVWLAWGWYAYTQ